MDEKPGVEKVKIHDFDVRFLRNCIFSAVAVFFFGLYRTQSAHLCRNAGGHPTYYLMKPGRPNWRSRALSFTEHPPAAGMVMTPVNERLFNFFSERR